MARPSRFSLMRYPWTRIPAGEPPLDALQLRLLPLANLFMALMWSRPGGLSLRTTWVTPATLVLSSAVTVLAIPSCFVAAAFAVANRSPLLAAAAVAAGLAGTGAGVLALYGFRQRILHQ